MSTNPTPTPAVTPSTLLTSLQNVGGYVTLAVQVGELVVPLVKGLITEITKITTPQGVVAYQVLVTADQSELTNVEVLADADLTAINAQLVADGKAPLVIPPPAAV